MTYILLLNCALKLFEEIILYYDARSKKHKKKKNTKLKHRYLPKLRSITKGINRIVPF